MKETGKKLVKNGNPFYWLEKSSIRRETWIKKQQRETSAYFSKFSGRDVLKNRLEKFLRTDEMRIPVPRGNLYFFRYRKSNEEQPSVYVKRGLNGKPKSLLNPDELPREIRVVKSWHVSRDGRFIAFELSQAGNDRHVIKVFDARRKTFTKDLIPETGYPYFSSWENSSSGFWYIRGSSKTKNGEKYYKKIYFHRLGEEFTKDKFVFEESLKKEDWPGVSQSTDGRYLVFTVYKNNNNTDVFLRDLKGKKGGSVKITRGLNAESYAYINNNWIYLITNHKAPNNKIIKSKILEGGKTGRWITHIPETRNKLEKWSVTGNYIFLEYLVKAHSKLVFVPFKGEEKGEIKLLEMGSIGAFSSEEEGRELFYSFSSPTSPHAIYKIDLNNLKTKLFWKNKSSKDLRNLTTAQKWCRSVDGTSIPMFIVKNRKQRLDGQSPTLVYAYGGFGLSLNPGFWPIMIPFLNDGGIFVLANIRGGGEFGEKWHKSAILRKKHKSFEDFSAVIKYLIREKYTSQNKVAIMGGSNGGLLVCVTLLNNPDLIKAALVYVPVTDMLRFHLFDGGRFWMSEYGNPDSPRMKKYLLSYSPYHNLKERNYPSTLFFTAEKDDRVNPLHTYKMFARMKQNPAQKNPNLLRVEREAGHSGANFISPVIEEAVDALSFVYKELGMKASKRT